MFVLNATLPKSLSLKFGVAINQDLRRVYYASSLFWEKVPILTRTDQILGGQAAHMKSEAAKTKCLYQLMAQGHYFPGPLLPRVTTFQGHYFPMGDFPGRVASLLDSSVVFCSPTIVP